MAGGAAEELPIRAEHRRQSPPHLFPRWHGPRETTSPPIHDELLLDIFLRIPNPADIVRTSVACVAFRRLIADRAFLRQYRKLHAPPLLGLLDTGKGFHPAEPPHPSASAASAVALGADFSFSFLPGPAYHWVVQDSRDGRVLLKRTHSQHHNDWDRKPLAFFMEIAVCDPLHRRYLVLPPVSEDLAAAMVQEQDPVCKYEAFLIPPDKDEAATSFRVMRMVQSKTKLFAFVFSSITGQWRAIPSMNWIDLIADLPYSTNNTRFYFRTYASHCFYWVTKSVHWMEVMKMLVFDTRRMVFSVADPPAEARRSHGIAMVDAGKAGLGCFCLNLVHFTSVYIIPLSKTMLGVPASGRGRRLSHSHRVLVTSSHYHQILLMSSLVQWRTGTCSCFSEDELPAIQAVSHLTAERFSFRECVVNSLATHIVTSRHRCCRHPRYQVVLRKLLRRRCWSKAWRRCELMSP